jgi:hypothetical protein
MGVREEQFIRTSKRQVEKRSIEDEDENDMRHAH